jgi:nucleotide-binding universal stress UspA family protein
MAHDSQSHASGRVRNILVGTDFSAAAERARDFALALAGADTTLTLVHAHLLPLPDWPDPPYVPDWMPAEPSVREETLERLRLFGAPARAAGIPVTTVIEEGFPADVILAQADALRPDLIAMGTHGRRSFERWLVGSAAERVLRLAPAPVLTVSAQGLGAPPRIREVLCPVGPAAGIETLAFASALAARCGSGLTVLRVVEDVVGRTRGDWLEKRARERLLEAAAATRESVHAEALVRAGRPSREILRAASERAVDVVVMGVHDRLPAERGFFGSCADQVVREAKCAVITVRPRVVRESAERQTRPLRETVASR